MQGGGQNQTADCDLRHQVAYAESFVASDANGLLGAWQGDELRGTILYRKGKTSRSKTSFTVTFLQVKQMEAQAEHAKAMRALLTCMMAHHEVRCADIEATLHAEQIACWHAIDGVEVQNTNQPVRVAQRDAWKCFIEVQEEAAPVAAPVAALAAPVTALVAALAAVPVVAPAAAPVAAADPEAAAGAAPVDAAAVVAAPVDALPLATPLADAQRSSRPPRSRARAAESRIALALSDAHALALSDAGAGGSQPSHAVQQEPGVLPPAVPLAVLPVGAIAPAAEPGDAPVKQEPGVLQDKFVVDKGLESTGNHFLIAVIPSCIDDISEQNITSSENLFNHCEVSEQLKARYALLADEKGDTTKTVSGLRYFAGKLHYAAAIRRLTPMPTLLNIVAHGKSKARMFLPIAETHAGQCTIIDVDTNQQLNLLDEIAAIVRANPFVKAVYASMCSSLHNVKQEDKDARDALRNVTIIGHTEGVEIHTAQSFAQMLYHGLSYEAAARSETEWENDPLSGAMLKHVVDQLKSYTAGRTSRKLFTGIKVLPAASALHQHPPTGGKAPKRPFADVGSSDGSSSSSDSDSDSDSDCAPDSYDEQSE